MFSPLGGVSEASVSGVGKMLSLTGMLCRAWKCAAHCAGDQERSAEKPGSQGAEGNISDDLTAIRGIGIVNQNRLNVAGIKSYAQLARADPEELRKILGRLGGGAAFEDWIDQARKLAGNT